MTDENTKDSPGLQPDDSSEKAELTEALEDTLKGLNNSIEKMEEIVRQIESGDPGWEDSVNLLQEANDLAVSSSRQLDQVVQDVVYGSSEEPDQREEDSED